MANLGIKQEEIIQVKRDSWNDNLFRPLLILTMIMCLNISLVNLVRLVNPGWSGVFFLAAMLLTSVEGLYSYRMAQRYGARGVSLFRFRLAEWTVLLLVIKLFTFLDKPLADIGAELQLIFHSPSAFFTTEYDISITLAFIAWLLATYTIADFEQLYDPYTDNRQILNELTARFFWGGGLLLVISGLTQWVALAGVHSLIDFDRPTLSGVILNVLVYFVTGLVLLSQVNLTRLLVRWRVQRITTSPELVRQWARYAAVFLGLMALVAFLLPTRFTLGFLETAGMVLEFFLGLIMFVLQLIVLLITWPITWLLSQFGLGPPDLSGLLPTEPPGPPPPSEAEGPAWLEVVRSLIFWLVALAVLGYFLKTYLDDHPELVAHLKSIRPLALLWTALVAAWRLLIGLLRTGADLVSAQKHDPGASSPSSRAGQAWSWLNLRGQPAQRQIIAYYLNLLNHAEKIGRRRREHQTPFEYEPNLQQTAPDAQSEIHDVTETFVRARYSRDKFDQEDVERVKTEWKQIKKSLRTKR
ncbi:MAG TPA: DUF4129 domain-containing protein [Anaerolineae bacterium]|nr:DUF4129 domain-containing protein [Anaerolineae bacterium]